MSNSGEHWEVLWKRQAKRLPTRTSTHSDDFVHNSVISCWIWLGIHKCCSSDELTRHNAIYIICMAVSKTILISHLEFGSLLVFRPKSFGFQLVIVELLPLVHVTKNTGTTCATPCYQITELAADLKTLGTTGTGSFLNTSTLISRSLIV